MLSTVEEILARRAMYFQITASKAKDRQHPEERLFTFDFSRENRQSISLTPSEMIKLRDVLSEEIEKLGAN